MFGSVECQVINEETSRPKLDDNFKSITYRESYVDLKNHDVADGMMPDHFKRQLEEEKVKIAHAKVFSSDNQEEYEDDGFHEALNATTVEVWGNATSNEIKEES